MVSKCEPVKRHFLAWIPHERPDTAPIIDDKSSISTRAFKPTAHVTGQRLAQRVRTGDIIWLVGSYRRMGRPEASFDGRIVVANVRKEGNKLIFAAGDGSAWLPWVDSTELLYSCKFATRRGLITLERSRALGQQLRFTLQISSRSALEVEGFARAVLRRPSLFVSYRWAKSSDVVAALIPMLSALGYAVWWDRWSGPRRLAKEKAPSPELALMLAMAIEHASTALVVLSPGYRTRLHAFTHATSCPSQRRRTSPKYHRKPRWTELEYKEIKRQEDIRKNFRKIVVSDTELRNLVSQNNVKKLLSPAEQP
jgi:TIR domain